jgi:MATE family multidrug resistance protein
VAGGGRGLTAGARLRGFWRGPGGGRDVLLIAYPLILSQLSFTLQTISDRLFLTWYSSAAVAGAVTGLLTTLGIVGLFVGTGEYLTTFISQYLGAGRPRRVGPALWQGIYFSVLAGLLCAALAPLASVAFSAAGHDPLLTAYETTYARILMLGALPAILMATLSSFFAGRGATRVVLVVNLAITVLDVVLNYLWIFGRGGFPRAGVAGAAWSTVLSQGVGAALYLLLIFRRTHREAFATLAGWRPEPRLLLRFLRFGLPSGLQYSLELLAFALFMMIIGRKGVVPLAATGIAFNLNMIVFMPTIGLGIGVAALVARYLGAGRPEHAERATWSAFTMSLAYMLACGALYVLLPRLLLAPYAWGAEPRAFAEVEAVAVVLLRFVAFYSIFDMMNVVFAAGLRGAGDTFYPMAASVALSWLVMLAPAYLLCVVRDGSVYTAWTAASVYIVCLGVLLLRRFRAGAWKRLRVIEAPVADVDLGPASEYA